MPTTILGNGSSHVGGVDIILFTVIFSFSTVKVYATFISNSSSILPLTYLCSCPKLRKQRWKLMVLQEAKSVASRHRQEFHCYDTIASKELYQILPHWRRLVHIHQKISGEHQQNKRKAFRNNNLDDKYAFVTQTGKDVVMRENRNHATLHVPILDWCKKIMDLRQVWETWWHPGSKYFIFWGG